MSQITLTPPNFVHIDPNYPSASYKESDVAIVIEKFFQGSSDTALHDLFHSFPIDMKFTNVPDISSWPYNTVSAYQISHDIHIGIPATNSRGNVVLLAFDHKGKVNSPAGFDGVVADFRKSSQGFLFQYAQQDGGCKISPDCSVILTPALSGCSFFMLSVGAQKFAFHSNVINENADYKRFKGVVYNILKEIAHSVTPFKEGIGEVLDELERIEQKYIDISNVRNVAQVDAAKAFELFKKAPCDQEISRIATQAEHMLREKEEESGKIGDELISVQSKFMQQFEDIVRLANPSLENDVDDIFQAYFSDPMKEYGVMGLYDKLCLILTKMEAREALSGHYATVADAISQYRGGKSPELAVAMVKDAQGEWALLEQPLIRQIDGNTAFVHHAGNARSRKITPPDFLTALHDMAQSKREEAGILNAPTMPNYV